MSRIQAILFDRQHWTPEAVRAWLREHNYVPIKALHETQHHIRARLAEPVGDMRIVTLSGPKHIRAIVMIDHSIRSNRQPPIGSGIRLQRGPGHYRIRQVHRGGGWGYFDAHPNLLGDIATTALAGLAIAGIVTAVKKSQDK